MFYPACGIAQLMNTSVVYCTPHPSNQQPDSHLATLWASEPIETPALRSVRFSLEKPVRRAPRAGDVYMTPVTPQLPGEQAHQGSLSWCHWDPSFMTHQFCIHLNCVITAYVHRSVSLKSLGWYRNRTVTQSRPLITKTTFGEPCSINMEMFHF